MIEILRELWCYGIEGDTTRKLLQFSVLKYILLRRREECGVVAESGL